MKIQIIYFVIGILLLAFYPLVFAKDIVLTVDQTDYYFKVGEEASIRLGVENSFGKEINGMFESSYTQEINQGGSHFTNSNTQSKSFAMPAGDTNITIGFGMSNNPMTMKASIAFNYDEGGSKQAILSQINVHFVTEDSQKQNKQNPIKSTSTKQESSEDNQEEKDNFASQAKKMLDEMMKNENENYNKMPNPAQQKLQNNQMQQDSSALKKEMQKQVDEQQQIKKDFQDALSKNLELGKANQELQQQGYKLDGGNTNPTSNDSGDFELNYKNEKGNSASIKGKMVNGTINDMNIDSLEQRQKLMQQLQDNKKFKEFSNQLNKSGFEQKDIQLEMKQNSTITSNYGNKENQTAQITAHVVNGKIEDVKLIEQKKKNSFWYIILFLLAGVLVYGYLQKKNVLQGSGVGVAEEHFDYLAESQKLLELAKKLFAENQFKDAYGKANQSVRLYFAYKNNLNKELTNDELLNHFKKGKKETKELKEFFDLCSLVEFAKYIASKGDFDKIIAYAEKILKR